MTWIVVGDRLQHRSENFVVIEFPNNERICSPSTIISSQVVPKKVNLLLSVCLGFTPNVVDLVF